MRVLKVAADWLSSVWSYLVKEFSSVFSFRNNSSGSTKSETEPSQVCSNFIPFSVDDLDSLLLQLEELGTSFGDLWSFSATNAVNPHLRCSKLAVKFLDCDKSRMNPDKVLKTYFLITTLLHDNKEVRERISLRRVLDLGLEQGCASYEVYVRSFLAHKSLGAFISQKIKDRDCNRQCDDAAGNLFWLLYLDCDRQFGCWLPYVKRIIALGDFEKTYYNEFLCVLMRILVSQIESNQLKLDLVVAIESAIFDFRQSQAALSNFAESLGWNSLYLTTFKLFDSVKRFLARHYYFVKYISSTDFLTNSEGGCIEPTLQAQATDQTPEVYLKHLETDWADRNRTLVEPYSQYVEAVAVNQNLTQLANFPEDNKGTKFALVQMLGSDLVDSNQQQENSWFSRFFTSYSTTGANTTLFKKMLGQGIFFDEPLLCSLLAQPNFMDELLSVIGEWYKEMSAWSQSPQSTDNLLNCPIASNQQQLIVLLAKLTKSHPLLLLNKELAGQLESLSENVRRYKRSACFAQEISGLRDRIETLRSRVYRKVLAQRDADWQKKKVYATFCPTKEELIWGIGISTTGTNRIVIQMVHEKSEAKTGISYPVFTSLERRPKVTGYAG